MQSFWPFGEMRQSGQSKMYRMGAQRGTGGGLMTTPAVTISQPDAWATPITNTGYAGGGSDTGVLTNPSPTGWGAAGVTATGRPYDFYFGTPEGNPNAGAKPEWQTKTMQALARRSRNPQAAYMNQWAMQYPRLARALGVGNIRWDRRLTGGYSRGRAGSGARPAYGSDDLRQAPQFEEYLKAMGEMPRPPQLPNYGNTMGGGTNYPGAAPGTLDAMFGPAKPWLPWPW
jgi:hypothetical protein